MQMDKEQGEMQSKTWPPHGQAVGGCRTEISRHHTALKSPGFVHQQLSGSSKPQSSTSYLKGKRPTLHYFFRGSSFYWDLLWETQQYGSIYAAAISAQFLGRSAPENIFMAVDHSP